MEHLWRFADPAILATGEPTTHLVPTLAHRSARWACDLRDRFPRGPMVRSDGTPQVTPKGYAVKLALFVVAMIVIFILAGACGADPGQHSARPTKNENH